MAERGCSIRRRDKLKGSGNPAMWRGAGNAFVPWATFDPWDCRNVQRDPFDALPNTPSPEVSRKATLVSEQLPPESSRFIPSAREGHYKAVYKPFSQSQWMPPLYGESVYYLYKFHEIKVEPLISIFNGRNFQFLILRQFLLNLTPLLEDKVNRLTAESEDSDDDELRSEKRAEVLSKKPLELETQMWRCWIGICKEIAMIAAKRTLGFWACEHLDLRTAWKLTKDLCESALRKTSRGLGRFATSTHMFATTLRGYFLTVAASWLINLAIDAYTCAQLKNSREALQSLARKTKRNTLRNGVNLVATALGVSIGTLLWPGKGTLVGSLGGPLAAESIYDIVEKYMQSLDDGRGLDFAPL